METQMKPALSIVRTFLISLLLWHLTISTAQEVGNELKFDYKSYSNKEPEFWGDLNSSWVDCKYGKMQSPVDLSVKGKVDLVPKLETVTRNYKLATNTILRNRGHDIQLRWHTLNSNRYDLELHIVHGDTEQSQNFAVIAILYKIGYAPDLAKLRRSISTFVNNSSVKELHTGVMDPKDIGISGREFYRYNGSLTTPPCTERVVWTVLEEIKTVSAYQFHLLQAAVHDASTSNLE
ncbi:hypothetical protein POM88_035369 [Heracleum sosnowskyi]|uniref:Alpha-carbonic anhydrase domain-containing protein n=1 Tax=Heracleum sosnowskyi TaxID=360622 RepID=A0AAD8HL56_9APIA|nr:hypothetical protein POM88_035369 [Heracleum sosnowskyi]